MTAEGSSLRSQLESQLVNGRSDFHKVSLKAGLVWAVACGVVFSRVLIEGSGSLFAAVPSPPIEVASLTPIGPVIVRAAPVEVGPLDLNTLDPDRLAALLAARDEEVIAHEDCPDPELAMIAGIGLPEPVATAAAPSPAAIAAAIAPVPDVIVIGEDPRQGLDPLVSYVRVGLDADPGAELFVDGAPIGHAPLPELLLAAGPHTFTVQLEDGNSIEQVVEVDERTRVVEF